MEVLATADKPRLGTLEHTIANSMDYPEIPPPPQKLSWLHPPTHADFYDPEKDITLLPEYRALSARLDGIYSAHRAYVDSLPPIEVDPNDTEYSEDEADEKARKSRLPTPPASPHHQEPIFKHSSSHRRASLADRDVPNLLGRKRTQPRSRRQVEPAQPLDIISMDLPKTSDNMSPNLYLCLQTMHRTFTRSMRAEDGTGHWELDRNEKPRQTKVVEKSGHVMSVIHHQFYD